MRSGRWSSAIPGARALTDHPRNTSDETIKAVADKGGVVGVYFMPFLTLDSNPKGEDLLRHVEHVANVAGEDHVGIGTDNGAASAGRRRGSDKEAATSGQLERIKAGIAAPGEGLDVYPMVDDYNTVDRYRRFAADLQKRGWSEAPAGEADGRQFPARLSRRLGRLSAQWTCSTSAPTISTQSCLRSSHTENSGERNRDRRTRRAGSRPARRTCR